MLCAYIVGILPVMKLKKEARQVNQTNSSDLKRGNIGITNMHTKCERQDRGLGNVVAR